jgi:hypothetical protein
MLRRRLTKRVRLSANEKRVLVELGRAVGQKAAVLLTVVVGVTFISRWLLVVTTVNQQPTTNN